MDCIKKYFCCVDSTVCSRLIFWGNPWKKVYDKCVTELNERAVRLKRERVQKIILITGVVLFFLWAANRQE